MLKICRTNVVSMCAMKVWFWWQRFGPKFTLEILEIRTQSMSCYSKWKWHRDEMFVKINGERYYLWRAVDHKGEVLESYVTKARDRRAALKFRKKSMRRYGQPQKIVIDILRSYEAAMRDVGNADWQDTRR